MGAARYFNFISFLSSPRLFQLNVTDVYNTDIPFIAKWPGSIYYYKSSQKASTGRMPMPIRGQDSGTKDKIIPQCLFHKTLAPMDTLPGENSAAKIFWDITYCISHFLRDAY